MVMPAHVLSYSSREVPFDSPVGAASVQPGCSMLGCATGLSGFDDGV